MASRTPLQRVRDIPPKSPREILEDGSVHNTANALYASVIGSEGAMALRGRAYSVIENNTMLSDDTDLWYTLAVPQGVYLVQYGRVVSVSGGSFLVRSYSGGSYTGGTALSPANRVIGATAAQSSLTLNASVTGGTLVQTESITAGQGAVARGTSGQDGGPVIYPPGSEFHLRVTKQGTEERDVTLNYSFSELSQAEYDRIGGLTI